jgi:large subunit ribosomal protein L16
MLMPKKTKYRKQQKGKRRGVASRGNTLNFGDFGLQAIECGWLTARQIEAARIAMTRFIKRTGRIWIRIFPDKPIAKTRWDPDGKRKRPSEDWVAVIRPGGFSTKWKSSEERARRHSLLASHKCRFIQVHHEGAMKAELQLSEEVVRKGKRTG